MRRGLTPGLVEEKRQGPAPRGEAGDPDTAPERRLEASGRGRDSRGAGGRDGGAGRGRRSVATLAVCHCGAGAWGAAGSAQAECPWGQVQSIQRRPGPPRR